VRSFWSVASVLARPKRIFELRARNECDAFERAGKRNGRRIHTHAHAAEGQKLIDKREKKPRDQQACQVMECSRRSSLTAERKNGERTHALQEGPDTVDAIRRYKQRFVAGHGASRDEGSRISRRSQQRR